MTFPRPDSVPPRQRPERQRLLEALHTLATLVYEGADYAWTSATPLGQERARAGMWRIELQVPQELYFRRLSDLGERREAIRRQRRGS